MVFAGEDRPIDTTQHPGHDEIALLAEGTLDRERAERLRKHFLECRPCYGAYADLVEHRTAWLEGVGPRVPDALAAGVKSLAHSGREPRTGSSWGAERRFRRWWTPTVAAAALALWLLWPLLHRPSPPGMTGDQRSLVTGVLGDASAAGWVLPGGEGLGDEGDGKRYRLPGATTRADLNEAIRALESADAASPENQETAVLLAGIYVATNRLDEAKRYLDRAVPRFPREPRLLSTAAVIAARRSLPAAADSLLGLALALDPENRPALFNRGLLSLARGDTAGAAAAFFAVKTTAAGTPLGDRASRELAALGDDR